MQEEDANSEATESSDESDSSSEDEESEESEAESEDLNDTNVSELRDKLKAELGNAALPSDDVSASALTVAWEVSVFFVFE